MSLKASKQQRFRHNYKQDIIYKLNSVLKQFIPEELFVLNEKEINIPISIKYCYTLPVK